MTIGWIVVHAKRANARSIMLERFINAAAGRVKADVVLKNASYVNVFTGRVDKGDIAVVADRIVGIGSYEGEREIDVKGLTVLPGYIDGHVHIESSMLSPEEFASLVVPRGTTSVIADPHEITNVCGLDGLDYIYRASQSVPLDVHIQLPSCVPATPFETSGAVLTSKDIASAICRSEVFGLGEFMNFPGVISADGEVVKKLEAAHAAGKIIDGHAPSVKGRELNAYLSGGISTDHECATPEEMRQKAALGMYVQLRHSSSIHDIAVNCSAVDAGNMRRFLMCTDDRHAADLRQKGHIDDALRTVVAAGLDPVWAVTIATLNAAECYGLKYRGGIAPYWFADLVVVDDLKNFNAKYVFKDGALVAEDGQPLFDTSVRYLPKSVLGSVHIPRMKPEDFIVALRGERARVIKITPGSILTDLEVCPVKSRDGDVVCDGDILKLAVVERHKGTGNIGRGLIKGYGFKGGAMGITIAHDSHNLILLGDDNAAMAEAANTLADIGGGMVLVDSRTGAVHSLPLDIGGLMSSKGADEVIAQSAALYELAYAKGVNRGLAAFMSLAFLSLAVIPHVKLLDTGLFDVDKFTFTSLDADEE